MTTLYITKIAEKKKRNEIVHDYIRFANRYIDILTHQWIFLVVAAADAYPFGNGCIVRYNNKFSQWLVIGTCDASRKQYYQQVCRWKIVGAVFAEDRNRFTLLR